MRTTGQIEARPPSYRLMLSVFAVPGWSRGRTLRAMAIVAVAYYIGVRIGLALTMTTLPVSTLWPPNAILLAALLLTPTRAWWIMLLAALPAHLAGELSHGKIGRASCRERV